MKEKPGSNLSLNSAVGAFVDTVGRNIIVGVDCWLTVGVELHVTSHLLGGVIFFTVTDTEAGT